MPFVSMAAKTIATVALFVLALIVILAAVYFSVKYLVRFVRWLLEDIQKWIAQMRKEDAADSGVDSTAGDTPSPRRKNRKDV